MGISRDSRHKRRATGGRMPIHKKKRKFEMGRQPAMTKLGTKKLIVVRGRGGNLKYRALKLDSGIFCWAAEGIARKAKILDVVYNASNNELVRTKTIVKNTIVHIDPDAFRQYYNKKYNKKIGKVVKEDAIKDPAKATSKKATKEPTKEPAKEPAKDAVVKKSRHLLKKIAALPSFIDPNLEEQFNTGRVLACISSRPGQVGRADGYLLEGKELEFYLKKMEKKKKT